MQVVTGQLVSIHDVQIRELQAALYTRVRLPVNSTWGRLLEQTAARWKERLTARETALRDGERGEDVPDPGSKHLLLGAALIQD